MADQRYTAVLFDFGGTLAQITPYWEYLYERACNEFGVQIERERIRPALRAGWDKYQTELGPDHRSISGDAAAFWAGKREIQIARLRAAGITERIAEIAERVLTLDTDPSMYELFPETHATLQALRERGLTLGIISNHEWELPSMIEALGINDLLAGVVTSARAGYRKPHPAIFAAAVRQFGVDPAHALYVGDEYWADIAGARRAGLDAVLIAREALPEPPDCPVIADLRELVDLLE